MYTLMLLLRDHWPILTTFRCVKKSTCIAGISTVQPSSHQFLVHPANVQQQLTLSIQLRYPSLAPAIRRFSQQRTPYPAQTKSTHVIRHSTLEGRMASPPQQDNWASSSSSSSSQSSSGISVAIVGSGFSGLCMAIQLKNAGIHDFTVFEAAEDIGKHGWGCGPVTPALPSCCVLL